VEDAVAEAVGCGVEVGKSVGIGVFVAAGESAVGMGETAVVAAKSAAGCGGVMVTAEEKDRASG